MFFFFNDTATTEIYTLSLHDALPIFVAGDDAAVDRAVHVCRSCHPCRSSGVSSVRSSVRADDGARDGSNCLSRDRKSTRLNSSHANISYAVFCLKKKKRIHTLHTREQ